MDKARLQSILENIPSAVVALDKTNGKVIYANKRAIELHGKDPCGIPLERQAKELKIYSMTGQLYRTEDLHAFKALSKGESFRDEPVILERVDGERFIINVSAKPMYDEDGKENGAIVIFDDVTDRMQTQEALMDSEERLNMAQRIAHLGSWEYFIKEDQAVWSDELFHIFGLPHQKFGPSIKDYLKLIHPDDRATMEKLISGGLTTSASLDYRIIRNDGAIRTIHTERAVRERDEKGQPTRIIGVEQDITERKQSENNLLESEERLKMAQRIAHMGSWEYHVKEDRALWSEELFRIFGLPIQKYGPNITEYFSIIRPVDRPAIDTAMSLQTTGHLYSKLSFDYNIQRPDGSIRTIHSERMVSQVDENQKAAVISGIEQDITERKQIEQKLEQYAKNLEQLVEERSRQLKTAERLAAIGQTAGMIGHDIRNPLQAIAGELYLVKQDIDDSPDSQCKRDVQESLTAIQEQVDYINKIIADLQDFARPLKPEKTEVDLCHVIPQLVATVKVPSNITLNTQCDPTLPKTKVDLVFLKRVLVNLATNAIQAMPNGGILTIKATHQDSNIIISVADTGTGISEEFKPKIFQPLMTTKSKGQGLGLAVVKRLVEAQGGTITFESTLGKGTEFRITFPKSA